MEQRPSICSLFHELFATDWVKKDDEFAEELKHYENAIKRLIAIDSQLTTFIRTQPIMDHDQLTSIPVVASVDKTIVVASVSPSKTGNGVDYRINSTEAQLSSVFSYIDISCGQFTKRISLSQESDNIEGTLRNPDASVFQFKCYWPNNIVQLAPALAKFMQMPFAFPGLVALKLLSHIDNKRINENGEIKCDTLLRSIFNVDVIKMDSFGQMVAQQTMPMEPISFVLDFPSSRKAISVMFPVMSDDSLGLFKPIQLEPAPIQKLLEEAVKAKQMIVAADAFLENPNAFAKNEVLLASREAEVPEILTSTFLYDQPWIIETGEEYLKTLYYKATKKK